MTKQKYIGIMMFAAAFVCLVLFFQSFFFMNVLHSFVNIFATGRTGIKTISFLLYLLIISCLLIFTRNSHFDPKKASLYSKIFFGAAFISYFLNLATYFYFVAIKSIPILTYSTYFKDGAFSSLQIFHNHLTKGALAIFTKDLPSETVALYDSGKPFMGILPDFIFYLQAGLIILCFVLIVSIFRNWIKKFNEADKKEIVPSVIFFTLASFMILKSLIDGGLLSFEAVIGTSMMAILLFEKSRLARSLSLVIFVGYAIFIDVLYLLGNFPTDDSFILVIRSFITALILFAALFVWMKKDYRRIGYLTIILALVFVAGQFWATFYVYNYYNLSITKQDGAYVVSRMPIQSGEFSLVEKTSYLYLYRYFPQDEIKIRDMINVTGIADNMRPVEIPWKTCVPSGVGLSNSIQVISSENKLVTSDRGVTYNLKVEGVQDLGDSKKYDIKVDTFPCTPYLLGFVHSVVSRQLDEYAAYGHVIGFPYTE